MPMTSTNTTSLLQHLAPQELARLLVEALSQQEQPNQAEYVWGVYSSGILIGLYRTRELAMQAAEREITRDCPGAVFGPWSLTQGDSGEESYTRVGRWGSSSGKFDQYVDSHQIKDSVDD